MGNEFGVKSRSVDLSECILILATRMSRTRGGTILKGLHDKNPIAPKILLAVTPNMDRNLTFFGQRY